MYHTNLERLNLSSYTLIKGSFAYDIEEAIRLSCKTLKIQLLSMFTLSNMICETIITT